MCGIVGFVGDDRAAENVLDGLRRLEYRGYDSAGIATIADGEIFLHRRKGKLKELADLLRDQPLPGRIAIGHTRWATHGKPSDENAHPHRVDDVVLVHNGIVENFLDLRASLLAQGRKFESETDTEIIAHLIAITRGGSLVERVRTALARVQGSYAIAVISTSEPESIVVAKNASPLVIGILKDAGIIASDIPAILPYTREVKILEEGELAVIRPGSVMISTLGGAPVERRTRTIDWSPVMAEKGGHKHFMHKEIFEQPRAVADTLRGRLSVTGDDVELEPGLVEAVVKAERIMITACGTSYHAGLVGRLTIEELARIGCEVELASELRYRHPLMGPETLTLAVSQSGETADTLAAIKESRQYGSPVLSVVNVIDSSIARESDGVLYTHAGPEIGVASTKAFITQVIALYLLAIGAGRKRALTKERAAELLSGIRQLPRHLEEILRQEPQIVAVANHVVKARSVLFLGRGYGYPVALEGALKLKEIVANIQEARARDGMVIAVATVGDQRIHELADHVIEVPAVDPIFNPVVATVPLQLLAYHVADLRGTDIDQPRNLAKSVTVE